MNMQVLTKSTSSTIQIGARKVSIDFLMGTLSRGSIGPRPAQIETPFGMAAIIAYPDPLSAPPTFILPLALRGSKLKKLPYRTAAGRSLLASIAEIEGIETLPGSIFRTSITSTTITSEDRTRVAPILLEAAVHALNSGAQDSISTQLPPMGFSPHPSFESVLNSRRLIAKDGTLVLVIAVGHQRCEFEVSNGDLEAILGKNMRAIELSDPEKFGAFALTIGVIEIEQEKIVRKEKSVLEHILDASVISIGPNRVEGKKVSDLVSFEPGSEERIKVRDSIIMGMVSLTDGTKMLVTTKNVDELTNGKLEMLNNRGLALATPSTIRAKLEDGRTIYLVPIVKAESKGGAVFGEEMTLRGLDASAVREAMNKPLEFGRRPDTP